MNISNEKLQELIKLASKGMGISEQEFKEKMKNKNFDNPMINSFLQNPEQAKAMLQNQNLQKMISKFLGTEWYKLDDILSKVQQILGDPQKLEQFKTMASTFLGNNGIPNNINNANINQDENNDNSNVMNTINNFLGSDPSQNLSNSMSPGINPEILFNIQKAIGDVSKESDGIIFLRSIALLLKEDNKRKMDGAIKLIKIIKLMPLIKELNII